MANTITLDREALEKGETLFFETKDKDNLRGAELSRKGKSEFWIWFNGKLIFSCVRFANLQKRFNELNEKWDLEPATEE